MARRQYRLALLDAHGEPLRGAQYAYASDETPAPGLRIDLPLGTWVVEEVVATWSGDDSARLRRADRYGGTLVCRPAAEAPLAVLHDLDLGVRPGRGRDGGPARCVAVGALADALPRPGRG